MLQAAKRKVDTELQTAHPEKMPLNKEHELHQASDFSYDTAHDCNECKYRCKFCDEPLVMPYS